MPKSRNRTKKETKKQKAKSFHKSKMKYGKRKTGVIKRDSDELLAPMFQSISMIENSK